MIIRILLLFVVFYFFSANVFAGFYQDQNDFDPSFQDPSELLSQPKSYDSSKPIKQVVNEREPYDYELPHNINTNEKVVVVDPVLHAWGAYSANGNLIRAGRATAGAKWCSDIQRGCKTPAGNFRVYSLGESDCISSKYPINEGGGAPMPYCMYFNGSQGLHGSDHVVEGNISHGCVRLRVSDAEWLRYHFVGLGTKVIVKPY